MIRKYRLVIHRWIRLDLLITEQFFFKLNKNLPSNCILYKFSSLYITFKHRSYQSNGMTLYRLANKHKVLV
jgi:hypothetical protein